MKESSNIILALYFSTGDINGNEAHWMTRSAVKSDYVINIVRKPTTVVPLRVYIVLIALSANEFRNL